MPTMPNGWAMPILHEAGLDTSQVDSLQSVPWEQYLELANRARQRMAAEDPGSRSGFAPVADGIDIPKGIFFEGENRTTGSDVPLLLCSTFHEWNPDRDNPELESISFEGVIERLTPQYGARTARIVRAYAEAFPACRPIEIWAMIASNRQGIIQTANAKCNQQSPVYMAWFGWESPLFQRTPPGFPLHRHRVLAAQHRPHGHTYGRRQRPPPSSPAKWPTPCCNSCARVTPTAAPCPAGRATRPNGVN